MTLAIDKYMGLALVTQCVMNIWKGNKLDIVLATEGGILAT